MSIATRGDARIPHGRKPHQRGAVPRLLFGRPARGERPSDALPPSRRGAAHPVSAHPPRGRPQARAARRAARPHALADRPAPLPALAGQWRLVTVGLSLRARVHGALAPDPDHRPADDRRRDRRGRPLAPRPVPRGDRRCRDPPLRRQLHAALRDRADRRQRRGAAPLDALRRVPPLPARLLRPPRDGRGDLPRDERHLPRAVLHRLGRRPGDPERADARRRRDRPDGRQPEARADRGRSRCRRSRS